MIAFVNPSSCGSKEILVQSLSWFNVLAMCPKVATVLLVNSFWAG
jgi:hypothetical protein